MVRSAVGIHGGLDGPIEAAALVGDCEEPVSRQIDAFEPCGESKLREGSLGAELGADGLEPAREAK